MCYKYRIKIGETFERSRIKVSAHRPASGRFFLKFTFDFNTDMSDLDDYWQRRADVYLNIFVSFEN